MILGPDTNNLIDTLYVPAPLNPGPSLTFQGNTTRCHTILIADFDEPCLQILRISEEAQISPTKHVLENAAPQTHPHTSI